MEPLFNEELLPLDYRIVCERKAVEELGSWIVQMIREGYKPDDIYNAKREWDRRYENWRKLVGMR